MNLGFRNNKEKIWEINISYRVLYMLFRAGWVGWQIFLIPISLLDRFTKFFLRYYVCSRYIRLEKIIVNQNWYTKFTIIVDYKLNYLTRFTADFLHKKYICFFFFKSISNVINPLGQYILDNANITRDLQRYSVFPNIYHIYTLRYPIK